MYGDYVKDTEINSVQKIASISGITIRNEFIRTADVSLTYFPNINQAGIQFPPK